MKHNFFGWVKISSELMGSSSQAEALAYLQFAVCVRGSAVVLPMLWGRLWLGVYGLGEMPPLPVGWQAWTEARLFHYLICDSEEPC